MRVAILFLLLLLLSACVPPEEQRPVKPIPDTPVAPATPGHGTALRAQPAGHAEWFAYVRGRGLPADGVLLIATLDDQMLHMVVRQTTITSFPVSTATAGSGNRQDSLRTPLGLHEVCERYGAGHPPGRIFRSRIATSGVCPPEQWHRDSTEDYVLSRILRLRGLDPGLNAGRGIDSFARCIYLHGTNEEHRIGTPASHGCIRMRNRDIIDLFQAIHNRTTWCLILETIHTPPENPS